MKLQQIRGYPHKSAVFNELVLPYRKWPHWAFDEDLKTKSQRRPSLPTLEQNQALLADLMTKFNVGK